MSCSTAFLKIIDDMRSTCGVYEVTIVHAKSANITSNFNTSSFLMSSFLSHRAEIVMIEGQCQFSDSLEP